MGRPNQRYRPPKAINKASVAKLTPAWNDSLNNSHGQQSQPIIHDGVMFVTTCSGWPRWCENKRMPLTTTAPREPAAPYADGSALSAQPFFSTPEQRVALARQRYFEEGVRPSGLVSENVIQSWSRCLQAKRNPAEHLAFNTVTPSRVHSTLARSRLLLETAADELSLLEAALAGTACTVLLTDPQGVVVHATRSVAQAEHVLTPLAARVGVDLGEVYMGTNAPGLTARIGQPSVVYGGEHFFGCVKVMHCAAAPIRDVHGQVAGVLDVTSEGRPFGFDAAAVIGMHATAIENRLLRAQSLEHIVIHLQTAPSLLGTPLEGLAGVTADGHIAWVNNAAARLLGVARAAAPARVEDSFGFDLNTLAAYTHRRAAAPHRLPNGLTVWVSARMQSNDGARQVFNLGRVPAASPSEATVALPATTLSAPLAGASLRDSDRQLIAQTVTEHGGNVSKAARALGVSRGLIYRHLKQGQPA